MNDGVPEFFRYHLWANLRLLDACRHLSSTQPVSAGDGLARVRAAWVRLLADEEKYVGALTVYLPDMLLDEYVAFPGFAELRRRAERTGEELIMVAEQDKLDHVLHLEGNPLMCRPGSCCSKRSNTRASYAHRLSCSCAATSSSPPTWMAGRMMTRCKRSLEFQPLIQARSC